MILPYRMSRQVTPDHHLNPDRLTKHSDSHIGMRHQHFPVWYYILSRIKEVRSQLIQYLPLKRYRPGQDVVKGRNTIGSHRHHDIIDIIDIPDFTTIKPGLAGEGEIGC